MLAATSLVTSFASQCPSKPFDQCAGRGITKELCCPSDYKCVEQTKFYSSCLPKTSPPPPPPSPPPVPAGQCPTVKYGQCAGQGIATPLCCPTDFKCSKIHKIDPLSKKAVDFSMCIPEHYPPSPPPPPPSPPPVPAGECPTLKYGQCGGAGMTEDKCCPNNFECVVQSPFFHQCVPKYTPPSPPPSPPPVPAGQCPTVQYGQCDGEGIASPLCCPSGSSCVKKTSFFSQCMPDHPPHNPIVALAATASVCPTKPFDQCAGRGLDVEACCPTDYKCVEQTKFYSSCLPKTSPPPPPPSPPPVPAGQCPTVKYAQCDGQGIATPLCCPTDFKCSKIHKIDPLSKKAVDFSMCIPEHAPPPSPPSPPSPPPPPPVPAGECTTPKFGQCAGRGVASELCCPTGSACVKQDDFYSQCMPHSCPGGALPACIALCPAKSASTAYQACVESCLTRC